MERTWNHVIWAFRTICLPRRHELRYRLDWHFHSPHFDIQVMEIWEYVSSLSLSEGWKLPMRKRRFRRLHKIRMTKIKGHIKRMKDCLLYMLFIGKEHDQGKEKKCKEQQQSLKFQRNIKAEIWQKKMGRWDTIAWQRLGSDCLLLFRNPYSSMQLLLYMCARSFPLLYCILYIRCWNFFRLFS
jgi:hypothetical protein